MPNGKHQKNRSKSNNNNSGSKSNNSSNPRVWRPGDKLAIIPPKAGQLGLDHNFFPWYREWGVKIGKYGETYKRQFELGVSTPYDPQEEIAEYQIRQELSLSESAFQLSEEQVEQLEKMQEDGMSRMRRDNYRASCFEAWLIARGEDNALIKQENAYNQEKIKRCVAKEEEDKNKITLLFTDIMSSISENSQRIVRSYRSHAVPGQHGMGDGESIPSANSGGISEAETLKNWMFLFQAARDTHVSKVSGLSATALEERINAETKVLETMYHSKGSYTHWTERFEDQIKCLESLDAPLSDIKKRCFFMSNLNRDIFDKVRSDWINPRMQESFPDNFSDLLAYVTQEYISISQRNLQVVLRVERPPREEQSFAAQEAKTSMPYRASPCKICGKNHPEDNCNYRNTKFTIEQNRAYYLRAEKRKTASKHLEDSKSETNTESKSDNPKQGSSDKDGLTKGTIARPPAKKEGSNKVFELIYTAEEINDRLITDRESDETTLKVKEIIPEEIVFIYDTASTSGAIVPGYEGTISNIYMEQAKIIGQGGGSQISERAGTNTFGRFRQLKTVKGNNNLISHAQAEKNWQVIHVRPGYMRLQEWPTNKKLTGKVWHLYSDPDLWGDPFPRLVIRREELSDLLASSSNVEGCLTFYEPNLPARVDDLTPKEKEIIDKIESIHLRTSHTGAAALIRMIQSEVGSSFSQSLGVSTDDVELWQRYRGVSCSGCLQGKMKDHFRKKSTKHQSFSVGDAMGGDLIFVDGRFGKQPSAVLVDLKSGYITVNHLSNKSGDQLLKAISHTVDVFRIYRHDPYILYFDRERGVESIIGEIYDLGLELRLKAANQHIGKVEVSNRLIRETVRSVKCGIYDTYDYRVPINWNKFIISDTVAVINRRVPIGHTTSPYTMFTGKQLDRQRDFRVDLGHPIIAKRSKRLAADLDKEGLWSVPVRRCMNGEGTLLVYVIQTKSFRHIIKFSYARIPSWVINKLQEIPASQSVRFDEDDDGPPDLIDDGDSVTDDDDTSIFEGHSTEAVSDALDTVDSFEAAEEALTPEQLAELDAARQVLTETYREEVEDPLPPVNVEYFASLPEATYEPKVRLRGAARELKNLEIDANFELPAPVPDQAQDPDGLRRSTRERRPFKPLNIESFNILIEKHFILYEQALRTDRKDAAVKALDKELDAMELMKVWDPLLESDLSAEERKLIIDAMTNYVEKFLASGSFDKSKVRVLARGDQQTEFGDTSSSVCRIESIFLICIIAALLDLEVFKFDVVSAYLNTNMPDEVSHKWLLLPRHVSKRLVERDSVRYQNFMRPDGKVLVRMNKLSYGYKEAALGWYKTLMDLIDTYNYGHMPKDSCFIYKLGRKTGDIILAGISVDDGFAAVSRNSGMKEEFLDTIRSKFSITLTEGDQLDYLGMTFKFNREEKSVSISQKQFVDKLVRQYNVVKSSKTPSLADLFDEDPDSPLLKDQLGFLSINSSCNFAASRTFPEILPCTSTLASRYYRATEQDYQRAIRMIEYMNSQPEHHLYLRPTSLHVVGYSDASYAERSTGHSQTGGCVGVEGHLSPCMFIFLSSKQPFVAKSSCEAELVAANTTCEYFVWLRECLECLKLSDGKPATLYQDNKASIIISEKGAGSFKRTKHIRVRLFWISELIKLGELVLEFVPTGEMIADILTKPMVGNSFRYLREKLLGIFNKPE